MKRGASNIEVKKLNRNRVFRYVNSREKTSMPDIASALGMSGPTVLQIVKELKEFQIVKEVGEFKSTGGRKAKAIAPVWDACYALGIDITSNHVSLVVTDLSERVLKHVRVRRAFAYGDMYFRQLGELLESFIEESQIPREKIIGVGMAVPGIVDSQQKQVTDSHTLGIHHKPCSEFTRYIEYPCVIVNDANAAAITECVESEQPGGMIYLSLSNSVGGAVVFRQEMSLVDTSGSYGGLFRNIYMGKNWRSGEFGHMVLHPEGPACYCGKNGCLDVYCSALRLADLAEGRLESFFQELKKGDEELAKAWDDYLNDLAIAVDNLRMCFDCDVVLGGYVGSFMEPYIDKFRAILAEKDIFEKSGDYVRPCRYRVEASALGAAIYQIEEYIDSI